MSLRIFWLLACLGGAAGACHRSPAGPVAAIGSATVGPELDYDQLLLAAQSYIDAGRDIDAAMAAADAARLNPERPEAFVTWGRALAHGDQLDASAVKYEQARQRGSRDPALFAELASVYDVEKKYDAAQSVYRDYLTDHPQDAVMRDELALTLLLLNRADEAVAELQRAVAELPSLPQIQQDLGYALLRAGRFSEAQKILIQLLVREPQRADAQRFLAQAHAGMGDSATAQQVLDTLLARAPRDRSARVARARLRALNGAAALALEDYQTLVAERPDDGAMILGIAGALISLGRLDDAQRAVQRARASLGEHPQMLFRQAQIDWRRGNVGAITKLEELAMRAANQEEAWQELVYAAGQTHNSALAKRAAQHLRDTRGRQ